MRPLSPFLVLAAGLVLPFAVPDAAAAPRGHGFAHGGVGRAAFLGHRPAFHHAWRQRHHRHHGFHHRFHRLPRFGGFWPSHAEPGYVVPPLYLQPDFAAPAYPTVLDLPELTGIRGAPAAQPVIYVLGGSGRRARLGRKGRLGRAGNGVAYVHGGFVAGLADPWEAGPRIVEVPPRRVP